MKWRPKRSWSAVPSEKRRKKKLKKGRAGICSVDVRQRADGAKRYFMLLLMKWHSNEEKKKRKRKSGVLTKKENM